MEKIREQLLARIVLLACTALLAFHAPDGLQADALASDALATATQNVTFVSHIGGFVHAVGVQGNYAYIGEGPTLVTLDISDPVSPTIVGKTLPLSVTYILDLHIAGSYAYLAAEGGLQIVDISDPTVPVPVGFYDTPTRARGVTVAGSHAYIARWDGLFVMDVSNPGDPIEVGSSIITESARDVFVKGEYAYVATDTDGLKIVSVSSPSNPTEVGSCATMGAYDVVVRGDYAYVADGSGGLQVIDVSDPANPFQVSSYYTWEWVLAQSIAVNGHYAYIANASGGLRVVDISDPFNPIETGSYNPSPLGPVRDVTVVEGYAYITDSSSGLWVVDVTNPADPSANSCYRTLTRPDVVAVAGGYAYTVSFDERSLRVLDVTNPTAPAVVGFCQLSGSGWYGTITVANGHAYVIDNWTGMDIVDVSDPINPAVVGGLGTPGELTNVVVVGDYAYIVGEAEVGWDESEYGKHFSFPEPPPPPTDACLWVMNVTNPASPKMTGELCMDISTWDFANDVTVVGNYAYVAGSKLWVIDITDPANPVEVGSCDLPTADVVVVGIYAYAVSSTGLHVVDISDPTNPTEVNRYEIFGSSIDISPVEGYLYIRNYDTGLHVVDISEPTQPIEVASYDIGASNDLASGGNYIYIAAPYYPGGLFILRYGIEPLHQMTGRVLDGKGNPTEGILIAINTGHTATTDNNGYYTFTNVLPGIYTLTPRTHGYFWSPVSRNVIVPPNADGKDFVGRNISKHGIPLAHQALDYGDTLTYTVRFTSPEDDTLVLYDPVPTHTTYISDSLCAPTSVVYDPIANTISGTLNLTATVPTTVSFAARVEITGTVGLAPIIVNQACIHPVGEDLDKCEWSNQVVNFTGVWASYFPLMLQLAAPGDS